MMPCNIDARAGLAASKTGTWLAAECPTHRHWAAARLAAHACAEAFWGFEGRPNGEDHTDHLQQELFVLVVARLAAREILRAGIRGGRHRPRRCVGAGRNPAAVVVDPGAVPAP